MTSTINQLRMNMLDTNLFQASRTNKPTLEKILEEDKERVFATKGEDNYNEVMDFNGDGIVTYDEYMKYCEENAVSQYNSNPSYTFVSTSQNTEGQVRPVHIGRALESYVLSGEEKLNPYIETEV
ncbi:MAG: hypothetical protein E7Z93_02065 [Cyanobacteria bacterium SIG32]|nr:hypothetical protein [Cyanobacteria bacterium SIG32]